MNLLMAVRRLAVINNSYNAELVMKNIDGRLSLSSFGQGIVGLEILSDDIGELEDNIIVVSLDKMLSYLQVRYESVVALAVNEKSIKMTTATSSATLQRSVVRLEVGIPNEDDLIGEVEASVFDDLFRVGGISEDNDSPRPLLGGVYIMLNNGDIRTIAANGISFGYAWELGGSITSPKEESLIQASALQVARRYDWQGESFVKIYKPASGRSVCFGTKNSYLYLSELVDKEKFPARDLIKAVDDSASPYEFYVDSGAFKSYVDAAIKLSGFDDRSVTIALMNGKVMIISGKYFPSELEEKGQEFVGLAETMIALDEPGLDFTFRLDAKMAKQIMSLLAQVDKGKLRVALGRQTNLIFFSTPMANAVYAIAQIRRE